MNLSDFDYELPSELIAQHPAARRSDARLFVHAIESGQSEHRHVRDLADILVPGDLLVVNDTRVLPARLFARRESGAAIELLFLEPRSDDVAAEEVGRVWNALVQPAKKPRPGERLAFGAEGGTVEMRQRQPGDDGRPGPIWSVVLRTRDGAVADVAATLERFGEMPLPPYIERRTERAAVTDRAEDRERYQTVFARVPGAVAAPTAGLHLSHEILERLAERGINRASVTLHVGAGTFRPIQVEDLDQHVMHAERFELGEATVEAIDRTKRAGGRVVCVGTTSVRVLEHAARKGWGPQRGSTRLFLRPGSPFHVTDALLTNFHLPKSSLLVLVSAFLGRDLALALYAEAIERRYRFYSYGDAQLLLGPCAGAGLRR